MKNIWQKLVTNKKQLMLIALLIVVVLGGFLFTSRPVLAYPGAPCKSGGECTYTDEACKNGICVTNPAAPADSATSPAGPGIDTWVLQAVEPLLSLVVNFLGKLLTVVIGILISIAQYNGFISSPVVTKGWVLIRDICNMFFVVILIIMAFGTVFQKEQYSYKRLLSSMVFAAVLVNFSKGICGIIIDFSQVIMLTFINAVKTAAAGNFAEMLGLKRMLSITVQGAKAGAPVDFWGTIVAYGLAEILLVVALVVFTVITIIILLRIVQLWFLVILSPLAFLATVGIPRLSAYSSKWWDKFGNQVIIGPVLAIFLWLSLAVVAGGFDKVTGPMLSPTAQSGGAEYTVLNATATTGKDKVTAAITDIGNAGGLLGFIVGIAMLVASLGMAQEMGVAGAGIATSAANKMKGFAEGAAKLPWKGLKKAGRGVGQSMVEQAEAKLGIPLQPKHWKQAWEDHTRTTRAQRESQMQKTARARGVPTANQLVASVTSFKSAGQMGKRLFGRDKVLKGRSVELTEQLEGNNYKKEKNQELAKLQDKADTNLTSSERSSEINDLENQIQGFEQKAQDLRDQASVEADPIKRAALNMQADDFFNEVKRIKAKQDKLGDLKIYPHIEDAAKTKLLGDIQKLKDELAKPIGLEAQAAAQLTFREREDAKKSLATHKGDLVTQEQDLRKKITVLGADPKNAQQVADLTSQADDLNSQIAVVGTKLDELNDYTIHPAIDESAKKKLLDQLKEIQRKRDELRTKAELIRPTTMDYGDRAAMNQARSEELKRLSGVDDASELVGQYRIAQKNGETFRMEAILTKLTKQNDLNEVLAAFNKQQDYKGLQELMAEHFGKQDSAGKWKADQSAMEFGNDLTQMNKLLGTFRLGGAYKRDPAGHWQETSEHDHMAITLSESGKMDKEKFWRNGSWMGVVSKRDDALHNRAPVFDKTAGALITRDLEMILSEMKKARLSPELEKDMSHSDFMADLKGYFQREGLTKTRQAQADEILARLNMANGKYW